MFSRSRVESGALDSRALALSAGWASSLTPLVSVAAGSPWAGTGVVSSGRTVVNETSVVCQSSIVSASLAPRSRVWIFCISS